jgi:hypothetical protein
MANALYPLYKQLILGAGLNLSSLNIKVLLVDTGTYTYSAAHDFHNDVSGIVATSGNLASKTVTNGTFDAADITITGVSGATAEAIIVYRDSGSSATSELIAYFDTGVTGLPLTPNGGDVTIQWNASGIFAL